MAPYVPWSISGGHPSRFMSHHCLMGLPFQIHSHGDLWWQLLCPMAVGLHPAKGCVEGNLPDLSFGTCAGIPDFTTRSYPACVAVSKQQEGFPHPSGLRDLGTKAASRAEKPGAKHRAPEPKSLGSGNIGGNRRNDTFDQGKRVRTATPKPFPRAESHLLRGF